MSTLMSTPSPVLERPVYLAGVGGALPPYSYTTAELAPFFNVDEKTAERYQAVTGVESRFSVVDFPGGRRQTCLNETIAAEAAQIALDRAGITRDKVDCVITATSLMDYLMPTIGARLLKLLGIKEAMTYDLYGGCAQFMHGVMMATNFVRSGMAQTVLVTASETITSFFRQFRHPVDTFIFGDGAAAWVLTSLPNGNSMDPVFEVKETAAGTLSEFDGESTEIIIHPISGYKEDFDLYHVDDYCDERMAALDHNPRGNEYRFIHNSKLARKVASYGIIEGLTRVTKETDAHEGLLVPHQGTLPVLNDLRKKLPEGWTPLVNLQNRGNISNVCVPLAMHDHPDKIRESEHLVCAAVGVGFSFAAARLQRCDG